MDIVLRFIKENNSLIMAALFLVIIILTILVIITDIINKKKNKLAAQNLLNNGDSNMLDALKEEIKEEPPLDYTSDLSEYSDVLMVDGEDTKKEEEHKDEIKYVEEDEELEKTKAQIELKNLKEELLKAELLEKEKEEAKKVLEENAPTKDEIIDEFESNQEENAIISLDEFNKISDRVYDENEEVQYKDEGNEPISIQELEALYNTKEIKTLDDEFLDITAKEEKPDVEVSDIKVDIKEPILKPATNIIKTENIEKPTTKFKNSPIISPVFGLDSNDNVSNIEVENTANLDKLSEEIKKTTEVLNTLKELRKNLQ